MAFATLFAITTQTNVALWAAGLTAFGVLFFFLKRRSDAASNAGWTKAEQEKATLQAELLAVSKLVSAKLPADDNAHLLVIEAAQYLNLPYTSTRRIIGIGDYVGRYRDGLAKVKKIRELIGA